MAQAHNGDNAQATPPSFVPSGTRRKHVSADTSHTAQQSSTPPSYAPASARSSSNATRRTHASSSAGSVQSQQPQSFQPNRPSASGQRSARRSSGSSRNAVNAVNAQHNLTGTSPKPQAMAMQSVRGGGAVACKRGHRVRNIAFKTLAVLLVAMLLGGFLLWNWVDGKLNKSDWLTSKASTSGTSWLILGSDERVEGDNTGGTSDEISGYRTDTILVLTKPKHGPSSLISIPRDSLVSIDDTYMKINAVSQFYGQVQLVQEIEEITGLKIEHVAQLKFGGLENVVNALGGIELCYDQTVSDPYSGLNWEAGCHTADGGTALAFSRMRYADAEGDFGRAARQRQVIAAIMKKSLSASTLTNISTLNNVANATLDALSVDSTTNPSTLISMALAFRDASGSSGVSGSVYWTDPDYYVDGVGSSVLLDDAKNLALFKSLSEGTHEAGTVGTLAEES